MLRGPATFNLFGAAGIARVESLSSANSLSGDTGRLEGLRFFVESEGVYRDILVTVDGEAIAPDHLRDIVSL